MGGNNIQRKIDRRRAVNWGGGYGKKPVGITQSKNDKGRWGGRTREGAVHLPAGYFGNTDSRLRAASFKMETAVTRSGSENTSQRL